ncbi:MAG TPA: SDR family oxidoreductase [Acidimicrobiales bacterium]
MDLDGTVTVLTGASGGIGRAVAHHLVDQGGRLVLVARRPGPLAELAADLRARGGDVVTVPGDVSDPATARSAVDRAVQRFGRLDVLANAAGFGPPRPLVDLPKAAWDATIASCLTGTYVMCRAVLPPLLAAGRGRIVNVSSIAGRVAEANRTAYCAAKWGLEGFSAALRHELEGTGVRLHLLNPAAVATGWWEVTDDPQPAEVLDRMMTPDDVARALVWVLSQPDHLQVDALVLRNTTSPWSQPPVRG